MTTFILICGAIVLLLWGACEAMLRQWRRQERLQGRLQAIRRPYDASAAMASTQQARGIVGLIGALGSGVARSGLLSQKTMSELTLTLGASGLRGPGALGIFVGAKLLLLVLVPLLAFAALQRFELSSVMRNGSLVGAALVGLLGPDWWVRRRHKQHLDALQLGLPDALDLMVICAEAGLGFEPALNRVAIEIRTAHPAISEEFGQTASELRVVADSRVALINMGKRTGLDSIKRMTSMLAQTMRYGTPLGDALRVLSAEMRQEILIRFETRAARLPVLLTIPMILFILPCIFLIVGGPAAIQVMNSMH